MEIDTDAVRLSVPPDERTTTLGQAIFDLCAEVDRLRAALREFVADYDSACGRPASMERLRKVVPEHRP